MLIYFGTRKLQKTCSSAKEMNKAYGTTRARKLQQRLMELQAAANLSHIARVPPPRCHELVADRHGQLSVDLDHPFRLIFIPANDPLPLREDGGLDWERVTEIEVIEVVNYH